MFRRFSLYIDIVTSPKYYAPILKSIETYTDLCEPITNVSESFEKPNFIYNLLVIEYCKIDFTNRALSLIKESYNHVIVINVPDNVIHFERLYEHAIYRMLREGFYQVELDALLKEYIRSELLINENTLLDNLFNSAQNSIVITDRKGNIQYANPYFEELSEYSRDELINNSPRVIKTGQHPESFYTGLWNTITSGHVWEGIFINKSRNGNIFYEEATITPIVNSHDMIEKFLKIGRNITREKILLEELSKEIKVAKKVLSSFLPNYYNDASISFEFQLKDFNEIGGDFIYFKKMGEKRYLNAIIDVMGHGVSSALVALVVTQMFDDLMAYLPIADTLREINNLLCDLNSDDIDSNKYVTGIFMDIDLNTETITYVNMGHPDALFCYEDESIVSLTSNNIILGILNIDNINTITIDIHKLKRILTYTDGLYENDSLALDNAVEVLMKHLSKSKTPSDIFDLFSEHMDIKDDSTISVIELI